MNNKDKVKKIVADTLHVNESLLVDGVGPGDFPRWDSLANQAILSNVEKAFGFSFTIDDVLDIESLNDLIEAVNRRMK